MAAEWAAGWGRRNCWAGGGTKDVPVRLVGIRVSTRAAPAPAPPPSPSPKTEGQRGRLLLLIPPSLLRASKFFPPTIQERPDRCRERAGRPEVPLTAPPNPSVLSKSRGRFHKKTPAPKCARPESALALLGVRGKQPPPLPNQRMPSGPRRSTLRAPEPLHL